MRIIDVNRTAKVTKVRASGSGSLGTGCGSIVLSRRVFKVVSWVRCGAAKVTKVQRYYL